MIKDLNVTWHRKHPRRKLRRKISDISHSNVFAKGKENQEKINTRDYMKLSFLSLKGHKGPLSLKAKLNKSLHKTQSLQLFLFYSKEYQLNHNNAKNASSNIKNTVIALINDMKKCWS